MTRLLPRLVVALLSFTPLHAAGRYEPQAQRSECAPQHVVAAHAWTHTALDRRFDARTTSVARNVLVRARHDDEHSSRADWGIARRLWSVIALCFGVALVAAVAAGLLALAFGATATSVAVGCARRSAIDGLAVFLTLGGALLGGLLGLPGGVLGAWLVRSVIENPFAPSTTFLLGAVCGPLIGAGAGAVLGVGLGWLRRPATPTSV